MITLYYLFGLVFLLLEMFTLRDTKTMHKIFRAISNGSYKRMKKPNGSVMLFYYGTLELLYFFWAVAGLFSSQWPFFLAIIVMSFIPKIKIGEWATKIDAGLSIVIILLLLINKFHLHIPFSF